MKKLAALLTIAAFTAGTAGFAFAQAPAPKTEEKKAAAAEKKTDKGEMKKMPARNATGTVKSASADSIVVAGKEKGKETEWTFAVDSKTKIKKAGKNITAADLKAGDGVNVRYMEHDGKQVAQSVNVKAAGTAKKAEAKAKKEDKKQ